MDYVSFCYLGVILPVVLLLYKATAKHYRWIILLSASYLFFILISEQLIVYLIISTVSIYCIGRYLEYCKKEYHKKKHDTDDTSKLKAAYTRKKRIALLFGVLLNLGILVVLKYANFLAANINWIFSILSIPRLLPKVKFLVPIGISFYTLQAISYIVDVYEDKIEADHNFGRLALFMSFFPIIMEGPICRYADFAEDLFEGKPLNENNMILGIQRIVWGVFKNLVIADRLNIIVKKIFNNYPQYGGIVIIVGAFAYTAQLYMNFSGTIDITIGIGEMFGIKIPENFRQPFFSKTPSEFWQRWHITLGTWFKDYIFYPLSLNKYVKKISKKARKKYGRRVGQLVPSAITLFAVWICNGLWHGNRWSYIFYGMYYFVLIMFGKIMEPICQKALSVLRINKNKILYPVLQTVKMFIIIITGELFFRANGLKAGLLMFKSIFTGFSWSVLTDRTLLSLGLCGKDYVIVFIGLILVFIVSLLKEKKISVREKILNLNGFVRWNAYFAALLVIIVFGAYGDNYIPAELLYAKF